MNDEHGVDLAGLAEVRQGTAISLLVVARRTAVGAVPRGAPTRKKGGRAQASAVVLLDAATGSATGGTGLATPWMPGSCGEIAIRAVARRVKGLRCPMHAMLGDTMSEPATAISIRYAVAPSREAWELPEGPVPESTTHRDAADDLKQILDEWVRRTGRRARVVCNLAVKWDPAHRGRGVDPDACIIEPAPEEEHLRSLRTWEPGHVVPRVCFEVVSENHPYKDYSEVPERYAAMGTRELVVFDPLRAGPVALGGPVPLQVWRRTDAATFERVYFGSTWVDEQLGIGRRKRKAA